MEKEQTTIRLPIELKEKLQQEADAKGYTIRDLIVFLLWDYFFFIFINGFTIHFNIPIIVLWEHVERKGA